MFSSLKSFFDFSDLSRQASEAQVLAEQSPELATQALNLSEMSSNLSILVSFVGRMIGFFTQALGWIGGWGILLIILSFLALSLLNFLSPFRKSNYLLVVVFLSIYALASSIPLESLVKFWLVIGAPALLSLILYGVSWGFRKLIPQKSSSVLKTPAERIRARRHVSLATLRRERRPARG